MTLSEKRKMNRESQKKRRDKLKKIILTLGCCVCNETHPGILEVHHLSKEFKRYKRSQSLIHNIQDIEQEKAVVLCSNCHNLFHWHFGGKVKPFPEQTKQSTIDIINLERNKERQG
jgi:hypothetical protein